MQEAKNKKAKGQTGVETVIYFRKIQKMPTAALYILVFEHTV